MINLFARRGTGDRFSSLADRIDASGDCWDWTGALTGHGYGNIEGRGAHRVIYEGLIGAIPSGHDLDHLCRNRACVNPDHLEPVTRQENLLRGPTIPARNRRKAHCPQGHSYDETNTHITKTGFRHCRTCDRQRHQARKG